MNKHPLIQNTPYWQYVESQVDNPRRVPLAPDGWNCEAGSHVYSPDNFDLEYFGAGVLRVAMQSISTHAIKVYLTGRKPQYKRGFYRIRVKVEYLGDGEPSVFDGGWLWLDCKVYPYI